MGPSCEEREALRLQRMARARQTFIAEREANRLNRDGEATVIQPVQGLQVVCGPPPELAALRSELRTQMLTQENSRPPMATVTEKEREGPFVLCLQSYDRP